MNILENALNSKQQGDIGVATAIAYYTFQGYTVLAPLTDNARYDLVIEKDCLFYRVQCKTTQYKSKYKTFQVGVRTNGGNKSGNKASKNLSRKEIDLVFVVTDEGTMYEFPPEFFDGKSSINLSEDKDQYKLGKIFQE